jgi:hypothetical protein
MHLKAYQQGMTARHISKAYQQGMTARHTRHAAQHGGPLARQQQQQQQQRQIEVKHQDDGLLGLTRPGSSGSALPGS